MPLISGSPRDQTTSASRYLIDYGRTELILPQPLRAHRTYQHLGHPRDCRTKISRGPYGRSVRGCLWLDGGADNTEFPRQAAGGGLRYLALRGSALHRQAYQEATAEASPGTGRPLTLEELSLIQKDLAELQPLDAAALKIMLEKELLVYNIMLMRFSQRKADRLAMAPKETAALVKSMSGATGKISAAPIPIVTPDGRMIDVTPNQVVDDIRTRPLLIVAHGGISTGCRESCWMGADYRGLYASESHPEGLAFPRCQLALLDLAITPGGGLTV